MKTSTPIVVGPLLGFERGDFYTVCILTDGLAGTPTLEVAGQKIPFTPLELVGAAQFWRAEFQPAIPGGATGGPVTYALRATDGSLLADRQALTQWTFYVPGATEAARVAYASCNGFSSATLLRDTSEPYALWKKMAAAHAKAPFSLLLMGGDQLYADAVWSAKPGTAIEAWMQKGYSEQNSAVAGAKMIKEFTDFYDGLYPHGWRNPTMALMFATIPSVMMWDDHDIFDGWGSYPDDRQKCDVYQQVFAQAERTFRLFQLRGAANNRSRINPAAKHYSLGFKFRDFHILALDNRAERTYTQIMSEQNWSDAKAWLNALAGEPVKNLLVMVGVPAIYRSFATVEAVYDTTPWHEELEDDIHDHWSAKPHHAERIRLVMVLLKFLEDRKATDKTKGVLLSGDVHVGALGQVWNERRQVGLTQVISTGIVHPAPSSMAWVGITLTTSDTPEAIDDGDTVPEMLTPAGGNRYLRTRNFATLTVGTDSKLWVNWICEDAKLKPAFAINF
ncbi:MAG: alkaline phosphatase family protein [Verrucomicrobia bacterium]|nr:alkaline phosphatase family protein [Verrucomicrobiota bacterium]